MASQDKLVEYKEIEYKSVEDILVSEIYTKDYYIVKYKSTDNFTEHMYLCSKHKVREIDRDTKIPYFYQDDKLVKGIEYSLNKKEYINTAYKSKEVFNSTLDKLARLNIHSIVIGSYMYGSSNPDLSIQDKLLLECDTEGYIVYLDITLEGSIISSIDIMKLVEK